MDKRTNSLKHQVFYPSKSLARIVQRYEYIEVGTDLPANFYFMALPNFENGLLFSEFRDLPILLSNDKLDRVPVPSTNLIPTLNLPTYNLNIRDKRALKVILRPGMLSRVFGLELHAFSNVIVSLAEVFGKELEALEEQIWTCTSLSKQIDLIEAYLLRNLSTYTLEPTLFSCLDNCLVANGYHQSVKTLAKEYGVGVRQLNRLLKKEIGVSPQEFMRIHRFNQVIRFFYSETYFSLTSVAYQFGYADQSHFIREFKRMTKQTPKTYLRNIGKGHLLIDDFESLFYHGGVMFTGMSKVA